MIERAGLDADSTIVETLVREYRSHRPSIGLADDAKRIRCP